MKKNRGRPEDSVSGSRPFYLLELDWGGNGSGGAEVGATGSMTTTKDFSEDFPVF